MKQQQLLKGFLFLFFLILLNACGSTPKFTNEQDRNANYRDNNQSDVDRNMQNLNNNQQTPKEHGLGFELKRK